MEVFIGEKQAMEITSWADNVYVKITITNTKKEGDLATPKGTFDFGVLYYRKDRIILPKCKIKKKIIRKNMGWCDDSKSNKYNQEIRFPFKL